MTGSASTAGWQGGSSRTAGVVSVESSTTYATNPCRHCGAWHGTRCPLVKAIEYYPNGTTKRIEFFETRPLLQPLEPPSLPRVAVDPDLYEPKGLRERLARGGRVSGRLR